MYLIITCEGVVEHILLKRIAQPKEWLLYADTVLGMLLLLVDVSDSFDCEILRTQ